MAPLALPITESQWAYLAPEALLSRLASRHIDVDAELRRMLSGGRPNALHWAAAETLGRGGAVWTTNFDELIEAAARQLGVTLHRILPDDDVTCECARGHLVKVHGTLTSGRVIVRSEEVLLPLPDPWLERLKIDLAGAQVAVVGYAGADIDLRRGLHDALTGAAAATWFGTAFDEKLLLRRFGKLVANGSLTLELSSRPDLEFMNWLAARHIGNTVPGTVRAETRGPLPSISLPRARYETSDLLRARLLDDFGEGRSARALYRRALLRGPGRAAGLYALFTSGLIHGAFWRPVAVAVLRAICATPVPWAWPHRRLVSYLNFNADPERGWASAERGLRRCPDDPALLVAAASAAKECQPREAAHLALQAQRLAERARRPADAAWATFSLSLSLRWLGDLEGATAAATRLADGVDALAGPAWIAWGYFEIGALAALRAESGLAIEHMELAREVFTAAGVRLFVFDAVCGAIAAHRLAGDERSRRERYLEAREMLDRGERSSRFAREVLLVEAGEHARIRGRFAEAEIAYRRLAVSPTVAQQLLGLLGLGEVQRLRRERPIAASHALARSRAVGFGFGEVHAAVTLGLAGALDPESAEAVIARSRFNAPTRDDVDGLLRYCVGPDPDAHVICFP